MDLGALSDAVYDVFQYSYVLSYRNNQSSRSSLPIYNKIEAERKRTKAWANEVRSINIKNLPETFLPGEYERILDTLEELRHNYQQASSKLESVDYKAKDLEKLLSSLTAANNALQSVAHPPPMYSPRSREKSFRKRRQFTPEVEARSTTLNQESIRTSIIPPVRTIYGTAHSSLVTISVRRSDPQITRSASRLKLWGAGLFEMAIPLDTVFDSNKEAFRPVRQCILRILVDILVWAEQELNKLSNDVDNPERLSDSESAEQITALLGTDELIPLALESWKDRVDQHQYVQDGRVWNTSFNPVPGLVEILFDLLPALRATRRTYCSWLAEAEILEDKRTDALPLKSRTLRSIGRTSGNPLAPQFPSTTAQSISSEQHIFDESFVDLANTKLDQASNILKKLDTTAKKKGRPAYAPRLKREREALDHFHFERKSIKGLEAKDLDDILEKQKQLIQNLAEFIADSSDGSNPTVSLGFLKKRQEEKDIKRAESFLSSVTDTNRAMRNLMHSKSQNMEGSQP